MTNEAPSTLKALQFPCRDDNYGVLLRDDHTGLTISIDAPETDAIREALADNKWKLTHILTTHHHYDHVEGNEALKVEFGCMIIGPEDEASKIPGIDRAVAHAESFDLEGHRVEVIATGGHTLGEISYYFPGSGLVFAGDTLFALGCGRVFEGTPAMMHASLSKLAALPDDTIVYAGHEYSLANARFAVTVDPENTQLADRAKEIEHLRDNGLPTLPTTIGLEKQTNPFMRANDPSIRQHLGMPEASDAEVFAEIRGRKDRF